MNCIFCKIAKGELPCHKIYEDDYVLAFLDIAPVNHGHVLVITKKHVENFEEIDDLLLAYELSAVKKIGSAIKRALKVSGYNLIVNNGAVAGQIVNHFHCHLIPRRAGDGLQAWPQQTYQSDEAKKIAASLKNSL